MALLQGDLGFYNAMWTCVGDGTTDDTANIARAIQFAQGRPIYFPSKNSFSVSDSITTIATYTTFIGEGTSIIQTNKDKKTFVLAHANCTVKGFKITYPGTATVSPSFAGAAAIYGSDKSDLVIENNEIVSPSSCGIALLGGHSNCRVLFNKVSGMVDSSQDVSGIAIGYDNDNVNNCLVFGNTVDGTVTNRYGNNGIMFLCWGVKNKVIHNTVTNFRRYGIILYQEGNGADFSLRNNQIIGNHVENIGYPTATDNFGGGIYFQSSHYTEVIGNTVINSGINSNDISLPVAALENNSSSYCTISGNIIKTGLNGIRLTSSRCCTVTSNAITGMTKKGIFDYAGYSNIIDDNTLEEIAQEGITSTSALFQVGTPWAGQAAGINIEITNNTIQSTGIAIQVDKASGYGTYPTGARVVGNTATSAATYTLYCQVNKSIFSGNILGNTNATPARVLGITVGTKNVVTQNILNSTNTVTEAMYFISSDNVILDNDAYNFTDYLNLNGTTYAIKTNIGFVPPTLQQVMDKGFESSVYPYYKSTNLGYIMMEKTGVIAWYLGRWHNDATSNAEFVIGFNDTVSVRFDAALLATFAGAVKTSAPDTGSAAAVKFGAVASNRWRVNIGGSDYQFDPRLTVAAAVADIPDPASVSAEGCANKINALLASLRTAGLLAT